MARAIALALTALATLGAVAPGPAPAALHPARHALVQRVAAAQARSAAAPTANDDEQRGVHIPDQPVTPQPPPLQPPSHGDSPDRGDSDDIPPAPGRTGGSTGASTGTSTRPAPAAEARPALPKTGGADGLLFLYFGSLLVIAGVATRIAIAD